MELRALGVLDRVAAAAGFRTLGVCLWGPGGSQVELKTSDDYLLERLDEKNLYAVTYKRPKSIKDRLAVGTSTLLEHTLLRLWQRLRLGWV